MTTNREALQPLIDRLRTVKHARIPRPGAGDVLDASLCIEAADALEQLTGGSAPVDQSPSVYDGEGGQTPTT